MPSHEQWMEIIRHATNVKEMRYRVYHERDEDENGDILPYGGLTVVELGYVEPVSAYDQKVTGQPDTIWHPVARGVARVHPNDNYDKKAGRDHAIRRALVDFREGVMRR